MSGTGKGGATSTIFFLTLQVVFLACVTAFSLHLNFKEDGATALRLYLNIIWGLCFLTIVAVSARQFSNLERASWAREACDLTLIIGLIFFAGFIRFNGLEKFGSWFDEDNQIQLLLREKGPLTSALFSFQSPLDYIFNYMSLKTFGADMFTARIWSATLGTLTVPLTFILVRSGARRWIAILIALACAFHPWLLAYSRESRPYIGSVFAFALMLQWMWWAWHNNENKHARYGFSVGMVILFYYSAILPMILLGFLALVLIFFWRQKRDFVLHFWCSYIIAALLWLPYYLTMAGDHRVGDSNYSVWDLSSGFSTYIQCLWGVMSSSALGLVLVAAALMIRKLPTLARPLLWLALFFPLGMLFFSSPGVHEYFAERFVLLYGFLLLVTIGYALGALDGSWTWWQRALVMSALVGMVIHFARTPSVKIEDRAWYDAYEFFEKEQEAGGLAVVFSPTPLNQYGVAGFLGRDLFLKQNPKVEMPTHGYTKLNQTGTLIKELSKRPNLKYLYLFSYQLTLVEMWETLPDEVLINARRERLARGGVLIRINTQENSLGRLEEFFKGVRAHHNSKEIDMRYEEILLGLALLRKDCITARQHTSVLSLEIRRYQALRTQQFLQKLYNFTCR